MKSKALYCVPVWMPYVTFLHCMRFWPGWGCAFLLWSVALCKGTANPLLTAGISHVCWFPSLLEGGCSETLLWKLPLDNDLVTSSIPSRVTDKRCTTISVQMWNGKRFFLTRVSGVLCQGGYSMIVSVQFLITSASSSSPVHVTPFAFIFYPSWRWIWSMTTRWFSSRRWIVEPLCHGRNAAWHFPGLQELVKVALDHGKQTWQHFSWDCQMRT